MSFWRHLWRSKSTKRQIILTSFLALCLIIFFIIGCLQSKSPNEMWQSWIDPFLALSTIFIAAFIWWNEKRQDWENALPKKLDAYFKYQNKTVYQVKNAPLAGDDDIRQWGQQIGRQMNDDKNLSFNGFKVEGPNRERDKAGKNIMRYALTIWLQQIEGGKNGRSWLYDDDGKLIEDKRLPEVSESVASLSS